MASLQVLIDRIASEEVVDFFRGAESCGNLLRKLKRVLNAAKRLLDDADEKQIRDSAVKEWLDDLKDAVYDTDDVLDDVITCQAFRSDPQFKVMNFMSSDILSKKLQEILERLEDLVSQKVELGLREIDGEKILSKQRRTVTTSLVESSGVYGRDGDKEVIMKLLETETDDLCVIPIVGMGGIGKTTLAQLLYNDTKVDTLFDLKSWVCVSEEFDVYRVTKNILKEVSADLRSYDTMTENQLHNALEKTLTGKKFLIILDDVWNDKYEHWEHLRRPLKAGAKGSKVIVTTRNENVGTIMRTVPIHYLEVLRNEECWVLFVKHAFGNETSSVDPELKAIGRKLLSKCGGLPLAAKVLGGLLHSKRDVGEWERVLKSQTWEMGSGKILPVLQLSYFYLPPHLKRCFAYCAIFPLGYKFQKEELVLLWMAEGLIIQPQKGKQMKEVGEDYFDDLVSRSFFQQQSNRYRSWFVMHDLINELARFVAGEFCYRLENSCEVGKRTRHLSLVSSEFVNFDRFEDIEKANSHLYKLVISCFSKSLHTFLPLGYGEKNIILREDTLAGLEYIRVLSLSDCFSLDKLPQRIGRLRHLRYLNLSSTSITRFHDDFCSLYHLQTLLLKDCSRLVELPVKMSSLINLCHLDVSGSTDLQGMPPQMGKLKKLQKLTDFFLGDKSGSSIAELEGLQHLQGQLCIRNLPKVVDVEEASKAKLKGKKGLKKLHLISMTTRTLRDRDTLVLEKLVPHNGLEEVWVKGCGGKKLPSWLGNVSFSSMVSVRLSNCLFCSFLPPLGQLPSLKEVLIERFDAVVSIGPEFYGSLTCTNGKSFPSLQTLHFRDMRQWDEWSFGVDKDECGAFPLLQKLIIEKCPMLITPLPTYLPLLTYLEIQECQQLVVSLPRASPVDRNGRFTIGMERIHIDGCESINFGYDGRPLFNNLSYLTIQRITNLVSFPEGGISAPKLKWIELRECSMLKSLPDRLHHLLPCLEKFEIRNCPDIECFPEGGLPSKLESLEIDLCPKLFAAHREWNLPSLSELRISKWYYSEESFPGSMLLPPTLTSLQIYGLRNLKSLGLQGFHCLERLYIGRCPYLVQIEELPSSLASLTLHGFEELTSLDSFRLDHLTSLTELEIRECRRLESLPPRHKLPSSLSSLSIIGCRLLKRWAQVESSEGWPKISYDPSIETEIDTSWTKISYAPFAEPETDKGRSKFSNAEPEQVWKENSEDVSPVERLALETLQYYFRAS